MKWIALGMGALLIVSMLSAGYVIGYEQTRGFDGVSWKPVVPIRKVTLVNFDNSSYIDDYAYLAAVPANVFYDKSTDRIYSNPLLFYEPPFNSTDPKLQTLNTNKGIRYFMEDWISFCEKIEVMELIGMGSISENWSAEKVVSLVGNDPYEVAKRIALQNWEKSENAVVAVIDDFASVNITSSGSMNGTIPGSMTISSFQIQNTKPVGIPPQHNNFTIPEGYKFIIADMNWNLIPNVPTPTEVKPIFWGIDPDMQLYDWQIGQVGASENWMYPNEHIESYIYHSGPWSAAVTYMPTKNVMGEWQTIGDLGKNQPNYLIPPPGTTDAVYTIDITMYPGVENNLTEKCSFYCRNAEFKLTWDNPDAKLGLVLRDESGAEIASTTQQLSEQIIKIPQLGEGQYSFTVIKLNTVSSDVNFRLEYSWNQKKERKEVDILSSAAQGAILGSLLNAPLLYTKPDSLNQNAVDAIKTIGANKIYLVNLGGYSSAGVKDSLKKLGALTEFSDYQSIYSRIHGTTKDSSIVFSTIDPWSYWYVPEHKVVGEFEGALFVGPAAYAAAHHGCPVFLIESDKRLSQAVAWHNEDWRKKAPTRDFPSVACMSLTGRAVYDFLQDYGFDGDGMESMLTIADQYDIGTPWDRVFPGVAKPGRIMGSPVDTAYWISRSVFYPAMVFANPATDPYGVERITGSHSDIDPSGQIRITPGGEEHVMYPILETWVSYDHRFNERASQYWGLDYTTATGITPFRTPSNNPIDMDVNKKYGQPGMYWADLTESEVSGFYALKSGYTPVYCTNFSASMENINRGVLMWVEVMHGGHTKSGIVGFWYDDIQPEKNPWRGYEEGGCTSEPDSMCMSNMFALDLVPSSPATGYDGVVITILSQKSQTVLKDGYGFDAALQNAHSAGFMAGSCLIANTFLHLSLVRHGFLFQIIDPWVTSWYCAFAFQSFMRDVALGYDVGEAYVRAILHVGIGYMVNSWWWDLAENVEYFGDPDIHLYKPYGGWQKPESISPIMKIGGHAPAGAEIHYPARKFIPGFEIIGLISAATLLLIMRRRR